MASKILHAVYATADDPHKAGAVNTKTMREFDALCLARKGRTGRR